MTSPESVAELLGRADALVRAGDAGGAFALLAPLGEIVAATRETARLWAESVRQAARGARDAAAHLPAARVGAQARAVLARYPDDTVVVAATLGAVAALVERRPPDEPPAPTELALLEDAARSGRALLDALESKARLRPEVAVPLLAGLAAADALRGPAGDAAARAALEEAVALAPDHGGLWFDLGLLHKRRGRWAESLDATRRARALLGDRKPVLWNLAIAATALGQGKVAAEAWRAMGVPATVARGGMPEVADLPDVELRVPTLGDGHATTAPVPDHAAGFEVVRVARLSPCHGVVRTPTFRSALVDYGDVALFDGAPVLVRRGDDGEPLPCFPLLARLREGDEARLPFLALEQHEGDVASIAALLPDGATLVVQRTDVEHVCPRCAAGDLLVRHEHAPAEEHRLVRGKLIAAARVPLRALREALDGLPQSRPGVLLVCPGLLERLGDTAAAGKAHKAWAGLERTHARKG